MKHFSESRRYTATDELRRTIRNQGRQSSWIAEQIGVSRGQFSHILSGKKSIDDSRARIVAALLGTDFFVLWKVRSDIFSVSDSADQEAQAA